MAIPTIPLDPGDLLQVRVGFWFPPQAAYNILYFGIASISGGPNVALQALCDSLEAVIAPAAKNIISNQAQYSGIGMKRISPGVPTVEAVSIVNAGAGDITGDAYAKQVAGIVTKQTVNAGRRYRGRMYLPFVSEVSAHSDTTPTSTYLTAAGVYALATVAPVTLVPPGLSGVFLDPYIRHANDGTVDKVVNYVVRDAWATQRRRGDYGRPNKQPFT